MPDYSVKKLDKTQFELLIPLMKNCFGKDVSVDYFKWKFLDNPAGNFIGFIAVEEVTGEVAAYYGAIPEKYIVEGEEKTIYQSCDTMTHSNHRRKGLFQKLATHCYEYLRENNELFIIGFGGGQSTPGFIKFGWKRIFDFQTLFIPKLFCFASLLTKFGDSKCEVISDLQLLGDLPTQKRNARVYSNRNPEHLKWRYRNPLNSYKIVAFKENSGIEGYVCFYVQNDKIFLFDFTFSGKNSRKALVNHLKRQVIKENLKGIVAFCQEKSYSTSELKKSGFISNPFQKGPLHEKTPFIFYADDETMNKLNNPNLWQIDSYDHDAL
jgi:GNAT superfamily N-acetyltransferase